ncbi:MAG: hypothetical protein WBY28_13265, partial [Nitrososphaeraceae archaeon]
LNLEDVQRHTYFTVEYVYSSSLYDNALSPWSLIKQNAVSKFLSCVLCLPFHVILLNDVLCFLNECAVINTKTRH